MIESTEDKLAKLLPVKFESSVVLFGGPDGQGWRSYVIVRSVILSVSRTTHDRGNGRRPNMVGKVKR